MVWEKDGDFAWNADWRVPQAAVRGLLAGGERTDGRDGHGRTPLHVAAYHGKHDVMRALAKAGADVNALDNTHHISSDVSCVISDPLD
mgnify:CR=1 FL=1